MTKVLIYALAGLAVVVLLADLTASVLLVANRLTSKPPPSETVVVVPCCCPSDPSDIAWQVSP